MVREVGTPSALVDVELSPDGQTLAFSRVDERLATADVWLLDFARNVSTPFTGNPQNDASPLWSPDGSRLLFRSSRRGIAELFEKRFVGTEAERSVLDGGGALLPTHWSADGEWIVYSAATSTSGFEIWAWRIDSGEKPQRAVRSTLNATHGRLSPDTKWLAYASDEFGEWQVYVEPFPPSTSGKRRLSSDGGSEPRWRADGKELFYLTPDNKMMSVPVATEGGFLAGTPRVLFEVSVPIFGNPFRSSYSVTADGQRFLINTRIPAPPPPINLILNCLAVS